MGVIGTLLRLVRGGLEVRGNAPGKSATATGEGFEGQTLSTEIYQAPGILAVPGDGTRGVWIPVGGSGRYGVVVACHNYALQIEVAAGETAIYSTNAAGEGPQALIKLRADGSIELNGDSKRLVTHGELDAALAAYASGMQATLASGSNGGGPVVFAVPPPSSIDISSASTTTIKTGG
jgi:phage gp45-like